MDDNEKPPVTYRDSDIWFDIDKNTREITFRKEHPTYQQTRAEFASLGYDLDTCKTATEIKRRHLPFFSKLLDASLTAPPSQKS